MKIRRVHILRLAGFTLIEIMMSIVILSILLIMFFSFYTWINRYLFSFTEETKDYTEIRLFIESMERDELNSDYISYEEEQNSLSFFKNEVLLARYIFDEEMTIRHQEETKMAFIHSIEVLPASVDYIIEPFGLISSLCFNIEMGEIDLPICLSTSPDATTLYSLDKIKDENSEEKRGN